MRRATKGIIIALVVGIGIFGYSQYASASQIGATITQSKLLEENEDGSTYIVRLLFENPSVLVLAAGEPKFSVMEDEQTIGEGTLESFILPPIGTVLVSGTFLTEPGWERNKATTLKISGIAEYDVLFTTIEIPFVFYPDEEQIMEFID